MTGADDTTSGRITVFLADDNVLVREGVRALVSLAPDLEVIGTAEDYETLVAGAVEAAPDVVVTDIRMPPDFRDEGIAAAKEVRKAHPGTGIVILSQYDDPEYAISLLDEGSAGYGYLLKDRVGDGDRLVEAIREVATGGSVLDPEMAAALLGSEERLEYTVVGDTVNLAQRLQDAARPAGTILLSEATVEGLTERPADMGPVEELSVKGRAAAVRARRLAPV